MNRLQSLARSSIGAKTVVGLTGLALVGFVLTHMVGNLQVFAGQDTFNAYAHQLQSLGPLLWVARIGLLALFVTHIVAAVRVTRANKAARPVAYAYAPKAQTSTFMSRHMLLTGIVVLLFVAYHIAHFTLGLVHAPGHGQLDAAGRHDAYNMFVRSFQNPLVVGLYIVANVMLALHLAHGVSSALQSFGVRHPSLLVVKKLAGPAIGGLVVAGNLAMPISVLLGVIKTQGVV